MDIDIISLIKILWVHSYKIKIILDKNIQKIKYIDKEPINSNSKLLWFKFFLMGYFWIMPLTPLLKRLYLLLQLLHIKNDIKYFEYKEHIIKLPKED